MSARDYAEKWAVYYDYRDSRAFEMDYDGFPTILVVTTNSTAEERIARSACAASVGRALALPLLLTCEWRIARIANSDGLFGPIWRSADDRLGAAGCLRVDGGGPHVDWHALSHRAPSPCGHLASRSRPDRRRCTRRGDGDSRGEHGRPGRRCGVACRRSTMPTTENDDRLLLCLAEVAVGPAIGNIRWYSPAPAHASGSHLGPDALVIVLRHLFGAMAVTMRGDRCWIDGPPRHADAVEWVARARRSAARSSPRFLHRVGLRNDERPRSQRRTIRPLQAVVTVATSIASRRC